MAASVFTITGKSLVSFDGQAVASKTSSFDISGISGVRAEGRLAVTTSFAIEGISKANFFEISTSEGTARIEGRSVVAFRSADPSFKISCQSPEPIFVGVRTVVFRGTLRAVSSASPKILAQINTGPKMSVVLLDSVADVLFGTRVRIGVSFTRGGVQVDPALVRLILNFDDKPNARKELSVGEGGITRESTGVYAYELLCNFIGGVSYKYSSMGAGEESAAEGSFSVTPSKVR